MRKGNRRLKRVIYRMGHPVLRFFHFLVIACPFGVCSALAESLGGISYYFLAKYRKRAMKNLLRVFGRTISRQERARICRRIARNAFRDIVDIFYSTGPDQSKIAERIRVTGHEHLEAALSLGKGVIGVSAHLGNFMLLGFGLVCNGYPANVVTRPVRDPGFEKIMKGYREKQGTNFILTKPPQECVKAMLKSLRENEIVCLLVDQAKKRGSIFVDFFERPTATSITPAVLSLRTGAPIVPVFIVRRGGGGHQIFIEPAIDVEFSNDNEEKIFRITAEINRIIQSYVERYPDQWLSWTVRRWKHKPTHVRIDAQAGVLERQLLNV